MSDSNRQGMLFVPESVFNTVPSSPAMAFMRFTSESLRQDTQTVKSQEIRADRQTPDVIRTDISTSGAVNFELSAPTGSTPDSPVNQFDSMLRASVMSAGWSTAQTATGTTISAAAADNSFNGSDGDEFSLMGVGQWVDTSTFTNAANNGVFKIMSKPNNGKIIVAGKTLLVNETAGSSRTIRMAPQVVNGVSLTTYVIEKRFTDLTNEFALLTGQAINTLSLAWQKGAVMNGSFGFVGAREVSASSTAAASTIAATSTDVLNNIDDVLYVAEGISSSAANDLRITGFSLQLQNNLRALTEIGALGATGMGTGAVDVTGTLTAYFKNKTLMDKYLNFAQSSLAIVTRRSGSAAGWVFDMPRVRFTSAQRVAGGQSQDIIAELQFTSYRNATEDTTFRIARFV